MNWKNTPQRYDSLSIGLHAIAALFHHYFLRDDTLVRMLPEKS